MNTRNEAEAKAHRMAVERLSNVYTMGVAQAGYDTWAAKPHNKKWLKLIYHTPIPNDLVVCIAMAFSKALSPRRCETNSVGGAGECLACQADQGEACKLRGRAADTPHAAKGVAEAMAAQALQAVFAVQVKGTSQNQSGYGAPYGPPFFIIDTSTAEPEVNWPGELIEQVDDVGEVGKRIHAAQVAALLAALSPLPAPGRADGGADIVMKHTDIQS